MLEDFVHRGVESFADLEYRLSRGVLRVYLEANDFFLFC